VRADYQRNEILEIKEHKACLMYNVYINVHVYVTLTENICISLVVRRSTYETENKIGHALVSFSPASLVTASVIAGARAGGCAGEAMCQRKYCHA